MKIFYPRQFSAELSEWSAMVSLAHLTGDKAASLTKVRIEQRCTIVISSQACTKNHILTNRSYFEFPETHLTDAAFS
jgi:hypothetical protein